VRGVSKLRNVESRTPSRPWKILKDEARVELTSDMQGKGLKSRENRVIELYLTVGPSIRVSGAVAGWKARHGWGRTGETCLPVRYRELEMQLSRAELFRTFCGSWASA